jgi:hypothetical protein
MMKAVFDQHTEYLNTKITAQEPCVTTMICNNPSLADDMMSLLHCAVAQSSLPKDAMDTMTNTLLDQFSTTANLRALDSGVPRTMYEALCCLRGRDIEQLEKDIFSSVGAVTRCVLKLTLTDSMDMVLLDCVYIPPFDKGELISIEFPPTVKTLAAALLHIISSNLIDHLPLSCDATVLPLMWHNGQLYSHPYQSDDAMSDLSMMALKGVTKWMSAAKTARQAIDHQVRKLAELCLLPRGIVPGNYPATAEDCCVYRERVLAFLEAKFDGCDASVMTNFSAFCEQ